MMRNLLFIVLCVLISTVVDAGHYGATYPDYFDVNVSEKVYFYDDFTVNDSAQLILDGVRYFMNFDNATNKFYLSVLSDIEDDVNAQFVAVDSTSTTYNGSNNMTQLTYQNINTDNIYAFRQNLSNTTACSQSLTVCAHMNSVGQDSNYYFYIGIQNQSQNVINWYNSEERILEQNTPGIYCGAVEVLCLGGDVNVYTGVRCTNCELTPTKYMQVGVNNQLPQKNSSMIISYETRNNITSITNDTDEYIISFNYIKGENMHVPIDATFKFRSPFYYTFKLFTQNTTRSVPEQYENDFNYIYLTKKNNITTTIPSTTSINNFFNSALGWLPGVGNLYPQEIDNTQVFWGRYLNGEATVKLYESDNYSVNVLSNDLYFYEVTWDEEFTKPQYSRITLDSEILDTINVVNETNATAFIYVDKWEINKWSIIKKWISYLLYFFVGVLVLCAISFLPGGTKVIGAVVPIFLIILIKALGWL